MNVSGQEECFSNLRSSCLVERTGLLDNFSLLACLGFLEYHLERRRPRRGHRRSRDNSILTTPLSNAALGARLILPV